MAVTWWKLKNQPSSTSVRAYAHLLHYSNITKVPPIPVVLSHLNFEFLFPGSAPAREHDQTAHLHLGTR